MTENIGYWEWDGSQAKTGGNVRKQEIEKGVLLRQAQQFDASVAHFRELVARHPENVSARLHLSSSLRLVGAFEESLALLDAVLEGDPANRAALVGKVGTLAHRQQFADALEGLRAVQALYPDQLDLEIKQGVLLRQAQQFDASVAHFQDFVARHPESVDARLQLAISLRLVGAHEKSLGLLDAVLAAEPGHRAALIARVDTLAHRQQFADALEGLRAVQALYPDQLDLEIKQGVLLRQAQQLEDSVAQFQKIVARHPQHVDAQLQLAISLYLVDAHDESLGLLDAVLHAVPGHRIALIQLANLHLSCNEPEKALATNTLSVTHFPGDIQLVQQRANILARMSEREGVREQLQALFRQNPESAVVAQRLIDVLVQDWRYDSAMEVFRRFVDAPVLDNNGRRQQILLCLQYGELSRALDLSRKWMGAYPESLDAKLSFYLACCELPKPPVDLASLEEDLLRHFKGSSALAIARARKRQYELDFGGATAVLAGFLRENPKSIDVLSYLFRFLLGIDEFDRCLDLVWGFPDLPAAHIFDLAIKLQLEGRRDEADALLPRLEEAVGNTPAVHVRVQLLRRMCALQILRDDALALTRSVEAALSLKNVRAENRHYFTCVKYGLLDRIDGDGVPESISSPYSGLSLKEILRNDSYRPGRLKPEDIALARRISAPPDDAYEPWLKRVLKGVTVRHAVAHCYAVHPEKLDDLDGLVDFPDIDVLKKHAGQSEPFLVTGTHHGANAVVWRLLQSFPGLRVVAVHKQLRRDHPIARAALPLGSDLASTRELVKALRAGSPVAATLDQVLLGAWGADEKAYLANTTELQVFDFAPLRVPNLLPKLAWKMNLPSYWVQSYLVDGRVRIELVRLPDADFTLDRETWIRQWIGVYGKLVEAVLKSSPENLRVEAGLVREIAQNSGTRHAADRR